RGGRRRRLRSARSKSCRNGTVAGRTRSPPSVLRSPEARLPVEAVVGGGGDRGAPHRREGPLALPAAEDRAEREQRPQRQQGGPHPGGGDGDDRDDPHAAVDGVEDRQRADERGEAPERAEPGGEPAAPGEDPPQAPQAD